MMVMVMGDGRGDDGDGDGDGDGEVVMMVVAAVVMAMRTVPILRSIGITAISFWKFLIRLNNVIVSE